MVIIEKGTHILSVTVGAYNTLFRAQGYRIVGSEGVHTDSFLQDGEVTPTGGKNANEDEYESNEDEYDDEKPLSEMTFKELKDYATKLGINTNGMSSKREIREAIDELSLEGEE